MLRQAANRLKFLAGMFLACRADTARVGSGAGLAALGVLVLLSACGENPSGQRAEDGAAGSVAGEQVAYPETRRGTVVDSYFGETVPDPYRWLEDDRSEETAAWVRAQNAVTRAYLDTIPFRDQVEDTVRRVLDYERIGAPFFEGKYRYFYRNDGLQNQSVLYRQQGDGEATVFLDPNTFSEDGTVSMSSVRFSPDGSLVAYQLSTGGSDWRSIVVRDTESLEILGAPLVDVKFSGIAWRGNEGFYYSSYDRPEGSVLSAKTDRHKLYFHRLGTAQSDDELIFGGAEDDKYRYLTAEVTEDGRFLSIEAANSTSGNRLYLGDLASGDGELVTVLDEEADNASVVDSLGDSVFIKTDRDAPNGRIVRAGIAAPRPADWVDVIPQTEQVLSVSTGAGYFFANYMVDALSVVRQFSRDGELLREISLPDLGTASGFAGKRDQDTLYFSFTNYRLPPAIYSLDPRSGKSALYRASASNFDSDRYLTEQQFYRSADGTRVPLIITYAKGTERDGTNPTMLYGYGGFNVSQRPRFNSRAAAWLELGGVYAVANIRGGGEYGRDWHKAGTKQQKQNVFDDFIAAAEYLIDEGYTSREKLALRGGSNGGLLVGAVMTQRPDLFQVALPAVGVMDMLRYHTFTAGAGWAFDYGTSADSEEMFRYLLGYSPLHNLRSGVSYPATLVTTADHDDRVVPAHSFKFAAELQHRQSGDAPVLIRIETDAGHGAGTPVSKLIDQYADVYSFTLFNMGVKPERDIADPEK